MCIRDRYYDLTKLLDRPLKKGGNTEQQNSVVESFGRIINGLSLIHI